MYGNTDDHMNKITAEDEACPENSKQDQTLTETLIFQHEEHGVPSPDKKASHNKTLDFTVYGMSCAACALGIECNVKKLDGITGVSVSLPLKTMHVEFDESLVDVAAISHTVEKLGYKAKALSAEKGAGMLQKQDKQSLRHEFIRLVWTLILTLPVSYLAMGEMLSLYVPPFFHTPQGMLWNMSMQFAFTLAVMCLNAKYFISGFKHLWLRTPNMDSLVAVGSLASLLYGVYKGLHLTAFYVQGNTLDMQHTMHDLYFESAAMILFFVGAGKYLEQRATYNTVTSLSELSRLQAAGYEATVV